VRETARRREMMNLCDRAKSFCIAKDREVSEIIQDLEASFMDMLMETKAVRSFAQIGPGVIDKMREQAKTKLTTEVMGMTTTIPELDLRTMGLQLGEMSLVGGYNADGKTSFAMQVLAVNASRGITGAVFSHETDEVSVFKRCMAIITEIHFKVLKDPRLLQDPSMFDEVQDWTKIERHANLVSNLPISVDDDSSMDIGKIRAVTRVMAKKNGVKLVVVDFLQKVKAPGSDARARINNASEQLRAMAKEENVHVIALSQITQPDKKIKAAPTMFSFRESQGPVDDAHLALAVYRPLDEDGSFNGKDKILILKQREGDMNVSIDVVFNKHLMMYEAPRVKSYYDRD
jgi:replicative DNA helicase